MKTFGVWLWQNSRQSEDLTKLSDISQQLGTQWPIDSLDRSAYDKALSLLPAEADRSRGSSLLASSWKLYAESVGTAEPQKGGTGWFGEGLAFLKSFGEPKNVVAWACIGLFLFVAWKFDFVIHSLAEAAVARGVITFLFAIATVATAIIIVANSFLAEYKDKEEFAERFRQGKDILTVMIGVLGTILGFYFAQQSSQASLAREAKSVVENSAAVNSAQPAMTAKPK